MVLNSILTNGAALEIDSEPEIGDPGLTTEARESRFRHFHLSYCGGWSQQPGVECDISTSSGVISVEISANRGVLR